MANYHKLHSSFWTSGTGKALRGDTEAQLVALYLMTSPHSNMTGVYHCPVLYLAHETGISFEGALKALARLSEAGFCTYDDASEYVFVHRLAAYQVGESLQQNDNQVKGVKNAINDLPNTPLKTMFIKAYAESFHLQEMLKKIKEGKKNLSPFEAPSKPVTVTVAVAEAVTAAVAVTPSEAPAEIPTDDGKQARPASAVSTAARQSRATVATTSETWEAYAIAYRNRYGADPVRNATINGQLANFVKRLGQQEAPDVARFYVSHAGRIYVQAMHPLNLLVRDAEKLRTEWATGHIQTEAKARNTDRMAEQGAVWERLIQANEAQGGQ